MTNPTPTAPPQRARVISMCGSALPVAAAALHPRAQEAETTKTMLSRWMLAAPRGFAGVMIQSDGQVALVGSTDSPVTLAVLLRAASQAADKLAYDDVLIDYGITPGDDGLLDDCFEEDEEGGDEPA